MIMTESSIQKAMEKHSQKLLDQENKVPSGRTYKKPEKAVQKAVLAWAKENRFFLHVVEASGYDPTFRSMGLSRVQSGFPDLVGNTPDGLACYIELKSKDRRARVTEGQKMFLEMKIEQNCFAVVVDAVDKLDRYWLEFSVIQDLEQRRRYLRSIMPTRREGPIDEEFGF